MKKTLRTLMMGMMALLGCTALTSCTNDDEPQVAQQEGQKGYVEFTLSRGADTRTSYTANTAGGLDVTWGKGDTILVFYKDIENKTVIVEQFGLVSGDGTTKATFAKSGSQLAEKTGTVSLRHMPGFNDKNYLTQVFDFSEQSGLLENFADYDFFTFDATLTNGQISNPKYEASMAVFHFKANDINFGVSDAKVDFIFAGGANAYALAGGSKNGSITVKNVSLTGGQLNNDLYVIVNAFPAPTTLTIGNQTFELPTDNLEAGKMYTFAQEHLKAATPLTIEALAAGTITIKNPLGLKISYQKNGGKMVTSTEGDKSDITITDLAVGDKVQLFGDNKAYANMDYNTNIDCSGTSKVYGNIMRALENLFTFYALFANNTGLTDASGLILPATTLAEYCYAYLFTDCTSLETAPVLPATTLVKGCYGAMFAGCTSLETAPELPATTLVEGCYSAMFRGCTSLETAPELPATTLAEDCYYLMFDGCTALTEAPELPATTLAMGCYEAMFSGCTALTTAPALPATTLADFCYNGMFSDCTALTQAPALPATTLAMGCYYGMFSGCTSLTTAPELPATTLAMGCYSSMFDGCEKLNFVTCLATDISATDCTDNWLNGVAASGTFNKAASMADGQSWESGKSGIPSGWKVETAEP